MHGHSRHWSKWSFISISRSIHCVPLSHKRLHRKFSEKSYIGVLVDYFKEAAALSKFGSSEELIDSSAKDLVCLPLGKVSDDRALAFYPLRVAANLRQRDRVLIRPPPTSHPHHLWMLSQNECLWPTLEMSLESVINECNGEIITENKIIDQATKLLSLKNIWPEKSYLILVSGNMVSEVMQYSECIWTFFIIPLRLLKHRQSQSEKVNSDPIWLIRSGYVSFVEWLLKFTEGKSVIITTIKVTMVI